ncbi:Inositol polyphosphate 1-phosphatase [Armadillidium nasatum]|uniref:inositol-1,4-bisphosphate 1-phosphatase n=1 Tax=Armadillidium nasatum TaxID=96803 RepID=A0A5N5SY85_9CRUS|nr:Inositol polyphosphate 1-phosphatase [Armadillidium nasatum]
MNFLQTLLNFSERAAKLARAIRQDPRLFSLLVEEKGELEKNKRFSQDFKTLADVLIQESLKYYVALKFPNLAEHVKGEENSSFTNTLGEKIDVCICDSQNETASLLAKASFCWTSVLDGNVEAANILAEIVHGKIDDVEVKVELKSKVPPIILDNIGIWIDPIDSTSEYIHGNVGVIDPVSHIYHIGLPCVTVLVGVFDRISGQPVAGVINQPFAEKESTSSDVSWKSRIYWGINYSNVLLHSFPLPLTKSDKVNQKPFIVISNSENANLQNELKKQFGIIHATGAGYKSLVGSTFRWDTCAPHGILRSFGGGIISYKTLLELGQSQSLNTEEIGKRQILYNKVNVDQGCTNDKWCNKDGIVVYKYPEILTKVYESLKCL